MKWKVNIFKRKVDARRSLIIVENFGPHWRSWKGGMQMYEWLYIKRSEYLQSFSVHSFSAIFMNDAYNTQMSAVLCLYSGKTITIGISRHAQKIQLEHDILLLCLLCSVEMRHPLPRILFLKTVVLQMRSGLLIPHFPNRSQQCPFKAALIDIIRTIIKWKISGSSVWKPKQDNLSLTSE